MPQTKKAALVLSGGGALGAAHMGVLNVLEAEGFEFDFISGVSAGAIVGALSACGRRSGEMVGLLKAVDFFSLAFQMTTFRVARRGSDKLDALLTEFFGDRCFEDLKVPLVIGATDFQNGERVLLKRGRIRDAVRASISVPLIFEPFWHPGEQRWLADGGLTQNLPLDCATGSYGGSLIYAVDVATALNPGRAVNPSVKRKEGARQTLQRAFRILFLSQQAALAPDPRVIRILPDVAEFSAFDVRRIDRIMKAGEQAARDALARRAAPQPPFE